MNFFSNMVYQCQQVKSDTIIVMVHETFLQFNSRNFFYGFLYFSIHNIRFNVRHIIIDMYALMVASGKPFRSEDYIVVALTWAIYGATEIGFNPDQLQYKKEKMHVAKFNSSGQQHHIFIKSRFFRINFVAYLNSYGNPLWINFVAYLNSYRNPWSID